LDPFFGSEVTTRGRIRQRGIRLRGRVEFGEKGRKEERGKKKEG